jgi:hypothetical protein
MTGPGRPDGVKTTYASYVVGCRCHEPGTQTSERGGMTRVPVHKGIGDHPAPWKL